jgi:triacylglycerol esterase/lipase EstA (alpha/beta hydrolase family)
MIDIKQRNSEHDFTIVAHSMGGLVSRGAIQFLAYKHHPNVTEQFITLSTPGGGDDAARLAVETSPVVAPVWRDLTPASQYLGRLYEQDLPQGITHILLSSYAGDKMIISEKNDGAVTLKSQLAYTAQDDADKVYLINATHVGILTDPQTKKIIQKYVK